MWLLFAFFRDISGTKCDFAVQVQLRCDYAFLLSISFNRCDAVRATGLFLAALHFESARNSNAT